jgi:ABC-2 type transport system ATP-binding protein
MSDVAAEVRDLRMRYGTVDVLNGIDFEIRTGEVVALLGPNGAGKTTTIEILEGFRARSAGRVSVLGTGPGRGDEQWRALLWSLLGLLTAPPLLRRMASRESGSRVAARRERAMLRAT